MRLLTARAIELEEHAPFGLVRQLAKCFDKLDVRSRSQLPEALSTDRAAA